MSRGADPAPPGEQFRLEDALAAERRSVEAALERAVDGLTAGLSAEAGRTLRHGVLGGGKRIRPILCVAAFRGSGGDETAPVHDLAVSLELVHAYSLMHDDLPCMDDADLRRGEPTPHRLYGRRRTMTVAAALIPAAALLAWRHARGLGREERTARRIVRDLLEAAGAGGMVGGQALDLLGEERTLDSAELDRVHRMKTGALLSAAPRIGARAAAAPSRTVRALGRYGRELGLAFQITDDILDATGSATEIGKEPSDRDLAKSTYVSRYGLEEARRRASRRADRAREALREADVASPLLTEMVDYVIGRRS